MGSVQKTGDIRQSTEDRRHQAVYRRQEISGRAQKTIDMGQDTGMGPGNKEKGTGDCRL